MTATTNKYHVRVTLFGIVTLENHLGRVVENPSRQARPWLLLKYLLTHRERAVTMAELHGALPVDGGEAAYRVRLNRLREALAPLGLDGKSGLVQFGGGTYRLNPRYTLETDVDRFLDLAAQIRACPQEDPAGLSLCKEALALYGGSYLGKTGSAPWAAPYRDYYHQEFTALARTTLARTRLLGDDRALDLLCMRAPGAAPEEGELHGDICRYLQETGREFDLIRYGARPAKAPKKKQAPKGHDILSKLIIEKGLVYTVAANSEERPLQYVRRDEPALTQAYREFGLRGLLTAVARDIHRGRVRTRADSKLTRALRKCIHAMTLETFLALEEEAAVSLLATMAERSLLDPCYDPAEDVP
ncbi:MAG: hypothetical protein IKB65_10195 [Ruminiclostridium sp.]|nr:hypothetical protein [Ruminiclostridium sp.]